MKNGLKEVIKQMKKDLESYDSKLTKLANNGKYGSEDWFYYLGRRNELEEWLHTIEVEVENNE